VIKTIKSRVGDLDVVKTTNLSKKPEKVSPKEVSSSNASPEAASKKKVLSKKK